MSVTKLCARKVIYEEGAAKLKVQGPGPPGAGRYQLCSYFYFTQYVPGLKMAFFRWSGIKFAFEINISHFASNRRIMTESDCDINHLKTNWVLGKHVPFIYKTSNQCNVLEWLIFWLHRPYPLTEPLGGVLSLCQARTQVSGEGLLNHTNRLI